MLVIVIIENFAMQVMIVIMVVGINSSCLTKNVYKSRILSYFLWMTFTANMSV